MLIKYGIILYSTKLCLRRKKSTNIILYAHIEPRCVNPIKKMTLMLESSSSKTIKYFMTCKYLIHKRYSSLDFSLRIN